MFRTAPGLSLSNWCPESMKSRCKVHYVVSSLARRIWPARGSVFLTDTTGVFMTMVIFGRPFWHLWDRHIIRGSCFFVEKRMTNGSSLNFLFELNDNLGYILLKTVEFRCNTDLYSNYLQYGWSQVTVKVPFKCSTVNRIPWTSWIEKGSFTSSTGAQPL